ncbi:MAG: branched-chain amino acid aminotransferase [Proteobacteria bacterium]|nr:MAG: branched-chain amino acid aminotransferase [Pseudomonadota bacterium]
MQSIRIEPMTETGQPRIPDKLGFGLHFSDRMFRMRYTAAYGWQDPTIGPFQDLILSPAAAALHCGQMVFDGTKAYRRPDGDLNLFRVERNVARFNRSAARLGMPTVDERLHIEAIETLVGLEHRWVPDIDSASLYIRPVMIATEAALEVRASREYLHYIIVSPVGPYFPDGFNPVSVFVSHDHVRAVRGGTGEAKTPGNYAASIAVSEAARKRGCQQVLWLDAIERRYIDEVGAMNIAFVYGDKEIRTPPLSGAILHGVTRDSVLCLAPDLGFDVHETRMTIDEVWRDIESGAISEAFGMGTAAVIAPVGSLVYRNDEAVLNQGKTGRVARRLYEELTAIQYGRAPDPYGWTSTVEVVGAGQSSAAH